VNTFAAMRVRRLRCTIPLTRRSRGFVRDHAPWKGLVTSARGDSWDLLIMPRSGGVQQCNARIMTVTVALTGTEANFFCGCPPARAGRQACRVIHGAGWSRPGSVVAVANTSRRLISFSPSVRDAACSIVVTQQTVGFLDPQ